VKNVHLDRGESSNSSHKSCLFVQEYETCKYSAVRNNRDLSNVEVSGTVHTVTETEHTLSTTRVRGARFVELPAYF